MEHLLANNKYMGRDSDGQLELANSVGPILDVHTHLALTYVPTGDVDLAADAEAKLYLDPELPMNFDNYMNTNFKPDAMKAMRHDFSIGSLTKDGMRATHTGPALQKSMRRMGIKKSMILAIDLPFAQRNTDNYLTVAEGHEDLLPAASIHPMARGAEGALRAAVARGARAYKMHPAVQQLAADHPKAMRMYEICGELNIPVVWHCGPVGIVGKRADRRCFVKNYWAPIHDLPGTTFVLGHSGALQYRMAAKFTNMYENVYVELSCQGKDAMKHLLSVVPPERIINGSDWPFYHQAISILKTLEITEDNETLRRRIFWDNAATLFSLQDLESSHAQ